MLRMRTAHCSVLTVNAVTTGKVNYYFDTANFCTLRRGSAKGSFAWQTAGLGNTEDRYPKYDMPNIRNFVPVQRVTLIVRYQYILCYFRDEFQIIVCPHLNITKIA